LCPEELQIAAKKLRLGEDGQGKILRLPETYKETRAVLADVDKKLPNCGDTSILSLTTSRKRIGGPWNDIGPKTL
jgi:hypothetical protein